jgi:hypothetical protein
MLDVLVPLTFFGGLFGAPTLVTGLFLLYLYKRRELDVRALEAQVRAKELDSIGPIPLFVDKRDPLALAAWHQTRLELKAG